LIIHLYGYEKLLTFFNDLPRAGACVCVGARSEFFYNNLYCTVYLV